jgi:hypothetical protein
MRRDWKLVLEILQAAENSPPNTSFSGYFEEDFINSDAASRERMSLLRSHFELLVENGFIEGTTDKDFKIAGLTWKGHDLIEDLRSKPPCEDQS